jgi:hypothetical protein
MWETWTLRCDDFRIYNPSEPYVKEGIRHWGISSSSSSGSAAAQQQLPEMGTHRLPDSQADIVMRSLYHMSAQPLHAAAHRSQKSSCGSCSLRQDP